MCVWHTKRKREEEKCTVMSNCTGLTRFPVIIVLPVTLNQLSSFESTTWSRETLGTATSLDHEMIRLRDSKGPAGKLNIFRYNVSPEWEWGQVTSTYLLPISPITAKPCMQESNYIHMDTDTSFNILRMSPHLQTLILKSLFSCSSVWRWCCRSSCLIFPQVFFRTKTPSQS